MRSGAGGRELFRSRKGLQKESKFSGRLPAGGRPGAHWPEKAYYLVCFSLILMADDEDLSSGGEDAGGGGGIGGGGGAFR